MIKLFVGLGNPGAKYDATRHNAGFWFIDQMARQTSAHLQNDKAFHGLMARVTIDGQHRWLLQPQTFMNLSGKSVSALARFFKIEPEEILVIHDELDIVPGQAKLKLGGSHAGHNGLRDIHAQLGTANYWRLRLGVGHPGVKSEVINWVLEKPTLDHRIAIDQTIDRSLKALPELLKGDMNKAMMLIHTAEPKAPKVAKPVQQPPTEIVLASENIANSNSNTKPLGG
jgi:PTH1 family peptidyl-tRNA hydrolase